MTTGRERGAEDNPGPHKGLPKGLGESNILISMDPHQAALKLKGGTFYGT